MNASVRRKYMVVIATVVLSLPFAQLPVTTANAAICQGEAAYPPDLPDCLDPVVAAEQEARASAAASASASAAAVRAAQDAAAARAAVEAAAERSAAEAARIKADADKAAADLLAEKIRQGDLAAAAAEAALAAAEARRVADLAATAKRLADEELTRKITAQAAAQAAIVAAQEALAAAQERIAREIEEARAESERQRVIAVEKKRLADAAAAVFAEERIALDRAIAEKQALLIAKQSEASASASATTNARDALIAAGGSVSLRMAVSQINAQSVTITKQELLTESSAQSNLKIQGNTTPVFLTELESLRAAYDAAKAISDRDNAALVTAQNEKIAADAALAAKALIASEAQRLFREAALARTAADNAAAAAAAERTALENAVKAKEALALTAAAEKAAAEADLARKAAAETVASNSAASMESASSTLASITSDSSDSASLASLALAAFQNVAAASSTASNTAAAASAAADLALSTAAAAVRAREDADAAAALAARTASGSSNNAPSASVTSAEARAAQEAANKARELERQAQEAARLAAEAKAAEEKAAAEKLAAEEAAAKAKAAADRAAAQAQAKEEAKRNAARNQIAKNRAISKKIIQKIEDNAKTNTEKINQSSTDIKSAYEVAIDQLAKTNKSLALLKEKESTAQSKLNQAKSRLLSVSNALKSITQKLDVAVAKQAEANYATIKIQVEIDNSKKILQENEKIIQVAQTTLNDATKKYKTLNNIAQSAVTKAAELKKAADNAYKAWQTSLSATKLTASLTHSDSFPTDYPQTANAQTAQSKLKEEYDLAKKQYEIGKAVADNAVAEANLAAQVVKVAKSDLESRISLKVTLLSKIEKLTSDLPAAKSLLKNSTAEKNTVVANYTKSENEYAAIKSVFNQSEIDYQRAKFDTKYAFENATSQNNQVVALRKLSEFSKKSVAAAKDAINAIDEEVRNLENSQALDLLNSDIKIAFISTSIPVFIFTVTAVAAIYAYLARRKRRSKFDLGSSEMLAKINEQRLVMEKKPKKASLKRKPR